MRGFFVLLAVSACHDVRLMTQPTLGTHPDATPATGTTAQTTEATEATDPTLDSDGDGLTDLEELELGTDPFAADTDGDGFDDRIEVDGNTDPIDATDKPYAGGWPIDACRDDIESTGNNVGKIADDFALLDQFGETVHLHDFCAHAILLVSSAMWCGPCQDEAGDLQELYEEYASQGFLVMTLLGEDLYGNSPEQRDLEIWANSLGLDHPVLSDGGWGVTGRFLASSSFAIPTMHLIGEGAEVLQRDTWVSENDIQNALP